MHHLQPQPRPSRRCRLKMALVCGSWTELHHRRDEIVSSLGESDGAVLAGQIATERARWLVNAESELVSLLSAPSQLADRARELAQSLPGSATAPTFVLDGNACRIEVPRDMRRVDRVV